MSGNVVQGAHMLDHEPMEIEGRMCVGAVFADTSTFKRIVTGVGNHVPARRRLHRHAAEKTADYRTDPGEIGS